jgi:hypothetical protein
VKVGPGLVTLVTLVGAIFGALVISEGKLEGKRVGTSGAGDA